MKGTPEEVLEYIKEELVSLIPIEDAIRKQHKLDGGNDKGEYFYRGRLSYMRHLQALLDIPITYSKD